MATQTCEGNGTQTCSSACAWGACVCSSGDTLCGGACVDEQTNTSNCGSCGHTCNNGEPCNQGTCGPLSFSSPAGSYACPMQLTISDSLSDSEICYTTNGVSPGCDPDSGECSIGTIYGGPLSVSASETIRATSCQIASNSPEQDVSYTCK